MLANVVIEDLWSHPELVAELAPWHFDQWGPLTHASSVDQYALTLTGASKNSGIPSVLVACRNQAVVGSVSLLASDMMIRPLLTPWLAHLIVKANSRGHGVGAALVRAALARGHALGFNRVYLYTSGDLPAYYERLNWVRDEEVSYLSKVRTVMHYDLARERHTHDKQ